MTNYPREAAYLNASIVSRKFRTNNGMIICERCMLPRLPSRAQLPWTKANLHVGILLDISCITVTHGIMPHSDEGDMIGCECVPTLVYSWLHDRRCLQTPVGGVLEMVGAHDGGVRGPDAFIDGPCWSGCAHYLVATKYKLHG